MIHDNAEEIEKTEDAEQYIEAFNRGQFTNDGPYANTVGYGEKYPKYSGDNLVVEMNNSTTGIHYPDRTYERGFDLTRFGQGTYGAKQFISLLKEIGLHPTEDFIRVYRDLNRGSNIDIDYPTYWLYAWVTDGVMIATTCNPINGDASSKDVRSDQGYAGYIGIGGDKEAVRETTQLVEDKASKIKDRQTDGLFF